MTQRMNSVISEGRVAVITGAAKGIGAAIARELASRRMKLALLDLDSEELTAMAGALGADVLTVAGDVANSEVLERLREETLERFGDIALLVNNAGLIKRAGPWDAPDDWRRTLDVNFTAVLAAQHLFVPHMIEAAKPAAIVNLGSKEGITTPPGNAAYSVAKAGVKVLTEQLSHELIRATGGLISAHLLVPGYTWTPMNFPNMNATTDEKPHEPWTAGQVAEYFMVRLLNDDFYILCPDNAVTPQIDAKRLRWAMDDIILNRPALSRWHPDWKAKFATWMEQ